MTTYILLGLCICNALLYNNHIKCRERYSDDENCINAGE